ncbi:hypothetical protein TIFTF001_034321 [Ficus carica]|uniref:Uncharacterized protein n=1 Tax=Ficus carica TaxID=3494 RepID=A0AA88E080_FICCA|nr:hypothetical protein TIFTF001_034321 [Ficus carica]
MMGVGGRRLRLVGCQYNQCQTTNDYLGHNMEAGAGAILAEGVRALRAVATRVPSSDSYCFLGQMGIPKAAVIRAEKPSSARSCFTLGMNRQVVGYLGAREFSEVLPWNFATCRKLLMALCGWREGDPATEILKFEFKGSGWREVEPAPEISKLEFKGAGGGKSNRRLETHAQTSGRL